MKLRTFILNSVKPIISLFFLLIPRKKHIWIFGSWKGERFSDNSKYFFLYIANNKHNIRAIWVTRNHGVKQRLVENGYECYLVGEIKGIFYSIISKYHIVDHSPDKDILAFSSPGAFCIQLWHGLPIKNIGNYIEKNNSFFYSIILKLKSKLKGIYCWSFPYIISTSNFTRDIMYNAFCTFPEQMILCGYPRCDILINEKADYNFIDKDIIYTNMIIMDYKKNGFKVIGYFPTFRDHQDEMVFGTKSEKQLSEFNTFLKKNKIIIFTKKHWASQADYTLNEKNNNINFLNSDIDINSILTKFEVLITDYSGVYFDYLLLDKPIILYVYDFDTYKNIDRGFLFDYDKYMAGVKVTTLRELSIEILMLNNGKDKYFKKRAKMKKLFYSKIDSFSSERLFNILSKL
jgi:CDP-glycerol glycerophosphotransferase (TagB/SpsB family)